MDGVNHSEYLGPILLKAVILRGRNDQTGGLFGPGWVRSDKLIRTWLVRHVSQAVECVIVAASGKGLAPS